MASEAQLKADEEAEAALESVDQIEGVLRRPSQIGNQGKISFVQFAIKGIKAALRADNLSCYLILSYMFW